MSLRDKMLGVIADVNAQVAEREELVEMIAKDKQVCDQRLSRSDHRRGAV